MDYSSNQLKFVFSKKATKFDKIFTVDLTLCSKCQIEVEDSINFCGLLRKHQLYYFVVKHFFSIVIKFLFLRRPQKWTNSIPSIWHLLHNVKSTVKISSIFVAFSEYMNFTQETKSQLSSCFLRRPQNFFTFYLTLCSKCQIDGEYFVNFCGLLKTHEL